MESGAITFAGKYSEPDYEKIVDGDCKLAVESTMIIHSPKDVSYTHLLLDQSLQKSDMEIRSMLLNYQDEIQNENKKEETGSQLDQLLAALS